MNILLADINRTRFDLNLVRDLGLTIEFSYGAMAKSSKYSDKKDPVRSQKPKIRHKKGGFGNFLPG